MSDITGVSADRHAGRVVGTGQAAAFEALYRAHVGTVARAVTAMVDDRDSVADLVQETFARAFAAFPGLAREDCFSAWVCTIARNLVADHRRRPPAALPLAEQADKPAPGAGPEELAEAADLAASVAMGLRSLPARDVAALGMVAALGLSPAEMAPRLGLTPGATKVLVCRAHRRLRQVVALPAA